MPVHSKSSLGAKSVMAVHTGKDLWNRWVLSLKWKAKRVTDGESNDGDCDEVMPAGWGEPGGVNGMRLMERKRKLTPQVMWYISKRVVG